MSDMFTFTVPGGFQKADEILALAKRIRATGKPVQIQAYDTVQGLTWNGGRLTFTPDILPGQGLPVSDYSTYRIREAVERARMLNQEGIGFHLVFNNIFESIDTDDEDGNTLLQALHHEMNGVTIATESLRQHVAAHYPKYEKTGSICYGYTKDEEYQRAFSRYEKVVMLPQFAYEPDRLKQFPLDRTVFIANDTCYLFCPRKEHYEVISRCSLGGHQTAREQTMNLRHVPCLGKSSDYWKRTNAVLDHEWADKIWERRTEHLRVDGLDRESPDSRFTIAPATRRELIAMGVRCFKFQGREYNDAIYTERVLAFIERIVRDEIPG